MQNLHILSHSSEPFNNRKDAGLLLACELEGFKGKKNVVLGILRGGIIVAREIALKLGAELDIVLSRKIGAPMNPELAVGAVSENGELFVNREVASYTGADDAYIHEEKKRQMAEIKRRGLLFRKVMPRVSLDGKAVIMTDDGVATGATMLAALWAARREHPKKLIVALPVGPEDTLEALSKDADEVICLKAPQVFDAVGQFYLQFEQITDEEVLAILKEHNRKADDESRTSREVRDEYEYGNA